MPEGPELHLSALFINRVCDKQIFSGQVTKSAVSKNPDVDWDCPSYSIRAASRGKELKLTLCEINTASKSGKSRNHPAGKTMDILFGFGMSGRFAWTKQSDIEKHAHLHFHAR